MGMPKAKKKKIQQPEDAGPSQPQPVSAAAMPPPPPRPPKPAAAPAPRLPPDKAASQEAARALKEATKLVKLAKKLEGAAAVLAEKNDEKLLKVYEKVVASKKKKALKPSWVVNTIHKVELREKDDMIRFMCCKYDRALMQLHLSMCQSKWKDLQIANLQRRLRASRK